MNKNIDKVEVLMAVYNGELYLEDQLNSIVKQSYMNFSLTIRDDGSTDNTLKIVRKFIDKFPDCIRLITDNLGRLGAKENFSLLLSYSEAEYVMFCDQDDIWLPHKIELTFEKMKNMENKFGTETPLLVHSDLKVVSERLEILSSSFWEYHFLNPEAISLNRLFTQNVVTGCTVMFNQPLKSLAWPIPDNARWHDYWVALVAAAFGKIEAIDEPLVLYRQHSKNQVGAKKYSVALIRDGGWLRLFKKHQNGLEEHRRQAATFFKIYSNHLSYKNHKIAKCFAEFDNFGIFKKRYFIIKYRYYRTGFIRNLALLLFL